MLVIQRPRMGSTQPSDPNLPFGYTFDPSQDFLFLDAPEPAPGDPLLNENDARFLNSFFEDMTSDHFASTSFGEGLNFSEDWLNLPPQFMGTATSFGQRSGTTQASPIHGITNVPFPEPLSSPSALMPPPPPPPAPPTTSHPPHLEHTPADVLAAATLLQNGSMSRPHAGGHEAMHFGRGLSIGPPIGHLRNQSMMDFGDDEKCTPQSHLLDDHEHAFADMFGTNLRQLPTRPNNPPAVEVRWGSDSSFNKVGFVSNSTKETAEALENERLKYIECLEVSRSAATTRPSSPVLNGESSPLKLKTRTQSSQTKADSDEGPPRKRRKSKAKEDAEEADEDEFQAASAPATAAAASKSARKRKPKLEGASVTPPLEGGTGKRRKSGANGAQKPPRENLTEEQKRENHIKSEQKRRTLIKEGFDDLCELVPGLKGGGFSKSTMLAMAADWLEDLLKGNEELRQTAGLTC